MSYKTILTVLDNPEDAARVTDFGLALAATFEAHLIGLHAETLASIPIVAPMEMPDPVTVQALQEMARSETRDLETIFRQRTGRADVAAEWRSFVSSIGYASSGVIDSARSADLVVASQRNPEASSDNRADLENFLFDSGRPVLLVPYVMATPKPIEKVLIAWNGSREAARATFDALPLLKKAREIEIFTVDSEDNAHERTAEAGAEIAATLARHGLNVTATTEAKNGQSASALIENRLSDKSIDLLVMGAYTHSRIWEMLFGGVTKTLLNSMTALTLLSR